MLRHSFLVGHSSRFLEAAWFSGFWFSGLGFSWSAQSPSPFARWQPSASICVHNQCPVCPSAWVCHSVETQRPLRTPGPAFLSSCPANNPENQKTKKPENQYAERLLTGRSQQSLPGSSMVFWFSGFLVFWFGIPLVCSKPKPPLPDGSRAAACACITSALCAPAFGFATAWRRSGHSEAPDQRF